jgi:hypothetical protein
MTSSSSPPASNFSWKEVFLSLALDPHYTGCNLSSIKTTSLILSTQEKLHFLKSDPSLVLLTDDNRNSLLAFHHFQTISSPLNQKDQKLVAITRFNHMATSVIINSASIKNYSQVVPKWDNLKKIKTMTDLQNYGLETETTTLHNAIIIPLPIL